MKLKIIKNKQKNLNWKKGGKKKDILFQMKTLMTKIKKRLTIKMNMRKWY